MIRATLIKDEFGFLKGYSAAGHAGYARRDQDDIVCAAVSVLGATAVNSLETVCGIGTERTVVENSSGLLTFILPDHLDPSQRHDAEILMKALRQGLSDVEEQYPKNLKLTIRSANDPESFTNGGNNND